MSQTMRKRRSSRRMRVTWTVTGFPAERNGAIG
jgi:hypothetical protein